MSWYHIRMERLAIGAALAGVEPDEAYKLRGEDLLNLVARHLYDSVSAAPASDFGGDMDRAVSFHLNAIGPDTAPLVSKEILAGFAESAQILDRRGLQAVYQQLLINGAERTIDQLSGQIRDRSTTPAGKANLQSTYERLGNEISHRESLPAPDPKLLLKAVDSQDWFRTQPAGQPQNLHWYHNESIVLAGIIEQPATMWSIGAVIGHNAFTSPLHRDAFRALEEIAGKQYHSLDVDTLHWQIRQARDRGYGTLAVADQSPAEELAHLTALASGQQYGPRETAAAARNLVVWHHTAQLNARNNPAALPADQPMPYTLTPPGPNPGMRL